MNPAAVVLAALAGGLISVERKSIAQLMISRPIVVAPVIAAVLGDVKTGFAVGVPLELAFIGTASYGASTPLHESLAALFAAALGASASHASQADVRLTLPLAFYGSLPFAIIGRWSEARLERWNVGLVDKAEDILAHNHPGHAMRHVLVALFGLFALGSAVTLLGALMGPPVGALEPMLPGWLAQGLALAWPLALGTSAVLAVRAIQVPHGALLAAIAAVTVFAVWGVSQLVLR
jgi:mannose/fructose/N-acetylgalactosamine-specific phosphotransferase system component IIC